MQAKRLPKPLPGTPTLSPIRELLKTLQTTQETFFFKEALDLYIPPQVGKIVGDDQSQDVGQAIRYWLNDSNKQCLLLLGDSGSGKTLFGQWLTQHTWGKERFQTRIPLFIPLFAQKHPEEGLIDRYLKSTCGLNKAERESIKVKPLLLILDGFDELYQKVNLYRSNELWKLKDAKIIITCRSQALAHVNDYRMFFYPYNNQEPQCDQLQELVIRPFNEEQISVYVKKYIEAQTKLNQLELLGKWSDCQIYEEYIQKVPGLKQLLSSPFVLSLVVQVLPTILKQYEAKEKTEQLHLARIDLYDHFVKQWFVRQKQKLIDAKHIDENCPIEEAYVEYSKELSHVMLQNHVTSIQYIPNAETSTLKHQGFLNQSSVRLSQSLLDKPKDPWSIFFVEKFYKIGHKELKLSQIRAGCPLIKLGDNHYAFLHKSLLEYFAAKKLFEGAMNSASIALGCELNEKLLVEDPERINFFAERVKQDKKLEERLFDVLEESKYEERVQIAASNAITILNYAGISFSQRNLSRIRVAGADLSNAILDSTDLREADLRRVKLQNAWLNNAKLGGALMEEVQLGELPYLQGENPVTCVTYSPDGCHLISGSDKGNIRIWDVATGKWITTLKGHSGPITSFAFNPDRNNLFHQVYGVKWLLASGSEDQTICLWDIINHKRMEVIKLDPKPAGMKQKIMQPALSIAYSSDGNAIAIGTIGSFRLCTFEYNAPPFIEIDTNRINTLYGILAFRSVAYSPDDKFLASGCDDGAVYLWQLKTSQWGMSTLADFSRVKGQNYQFLAGLNGHTGPVYGLAFSPDGKILASGSADSTVRLWDISTQKCLSILQGHTASISRIVFNRDGKILASGSADGTVRLWDVLGRQPLAVLNGHTDSVWSVAFSPDGKILASGSKDTSVRFWNVLSHQVLGIKKNVSSASIVTAVVFNAQGKLLACEKVGNHLFFWDISSYQLLGVMKGYTSSVCTVSFRSDEKEKNLKKGLKKSVSKGVQILFDTRQETENVKKQVSCASTVAFSCDGKLLACESMNKVDNDVYLWDTSSYHLLGKMSGHTEAISALAFCTNEKVKVLASGSKDYTVCLWNILNYQSLGIMKGHTGAISALAFSSDGKILASGSFDKTICIWDTTNYKQLHVIKEQTASILSVAFNSDGTILASGTQDNFLHLWDISTRKCLNTLQLLSPIRVLFFKKEAVKTYLCVGSGEALYYFEVKNVQSRFDFVLLWSINNEFGLRCEQVDMSGVVVALDDKKNPIGSDATNERLLRQQGAVGKISAKKTEDVLDARRHLVAYNPKQPPANVFSAQHFIMPNQAIVSMVRKKQGEGNKHVFLIIEYIESDYYTIKRADFFLDQRQPSLQFGVVSGQALIEICIKPLSEMQRLAEQCVSKCWKISYDQALGLLTNLEADQQNPSAYLNLGDSVFYSPLESNKQRHNCLTWCEGHLTKVGIDVSGQQSWLDVIVAHPQYHLPKDNELTSGEKCLLM